MTTIDVQHFDSQSLWPLPGTKYDTPSKKAWKNLSLSQKIYNLFESVKDTPLKEQRKLRNTLLNHSLNYQPGPPYGNDKEFKTGADFLEIARMYATRTLNQKTFTLKSGDDTLELPHYYKRVLAHLSPFFHALFLPKTIFFEKPKDNTYTLDCNLSDLNSILCLWEGLIPTVCFGWKIDPNLARHINAKLDEYIPKLRLFENYRQEIILHYFFMSETKGYTLESLIKELDEGVVKKLYSLDYIFHFNIDVGQVYPPSKKDYNLDSDEMKEKKFKEAIRLLSSCPQLELTPEPLATIIQEHLSGIDLIKDTTHLQKLQSLVTLCKKSGTSTTRKVLCEHLAHVIPICTTGYCGNTKLLANHSLIRNQTTYIGLYKEFWGNTLVLKSPLLATQLPSLLALLPDLERIEVQRPSSEPHLTDEHLLAFSKLSKLKYLKLTGKSRITRGGMQTFVNKTKLKSTPVKKESANHWEECLTVIFSADLGPTT